METKEDHVKHILLFVKRNSRISSAYWYDIGARLLPVALTYVNSGLTAAVVTACTLVFADRRDVQSGAREKSS